MRVLQLRPIPAGSGKAPENPAQGLSTEGPLSRRALTPLVRKEADSGVTVCPGTDYHHRNPLGANSLYVPHKYPQDLKILNIK